MTSFTDQKPFVITPEEKKAFSRGRRFNCRLCGHTFLIGETARWVYANGQDSPIPCGNFFVCKKCDGPDVLTRAAESFNQAVKLAKQWDIYGPEWQDAYQRFFR
jgi:hypothetical protein